MSNFEIDNVYDIANDVYFEVIRYLGVYDECVENDPDTNGTRNTEYGRELYYLIEETIKSTMNIEDDDDEEGDDE